MQNRSIFFAIGILALLVLVWISLTTDPSLVVI